MSGVIPSSCVTLPDTVPGTYIDASRVVVVEDETTTPCRSSLEKPLASTRTSHVVAGSRFEIEYVPFVPVVAAPLTTPARTAWTVAPEMAVPPVARVMVPAIVPATRTVNGKLLLA